MTAALYFGASVLRLSTPLILAALGGVICERSGIINIALEGFMLVGAFAAAVVAHSQHSAVLGMGAGAMAGLMMALFYALFVIRFRTGQIVAGTAMNLLAAGLTPFLCKLLYGSATATPSLLEGERLSSDAMLLVSFSSWLLVGGVSLWMFRLRSGIWVRFAGENPKTLESQGISVSGVRTFAVAMSGVFAGLAGSVLSVGLNSAFTRNMTAGRGFMALAAVIFGKWFPIPAFFACLFFGLTEVLQIRLQGVVLWGTEPVPVQWIQMLPYLATMIVLAGWVGQSRAPQSLGLPFERG